MKINVSKDFNQYLKLLRDCYAKRNRLSKNKLKKAVHMIVYKLTPDELLVLANDYPELSTFMLSLFPEIE